MNERKMGSCCCGWGGGLKREGQRCIPRRISKPVERGAAIAMGAGGRQAASRVLKGRVFCRWLARSFAMTTPHAVPSVLRDFLSSSLLLRAQGLRPLTPKRQYLFVAIKPAEPVASTPPATARSSTTRTTSSNETQNSEAANNAFPSPLLRWWSSASGSRGSSRARTRRRPPTARRAARSCRTRRRRAKPERRCRA